MSDEKTVSEREAVKRERKAWLAAKQQFYASSVRLDINVDDVKDAARRYPLPKRIVPRVVTDPHQLDVRWKIVADDGKKPALAMSRSGDAYKIWPLDRERTYGQYVTQERAEAWADLFANPNEMVDDEG